MLSMGRHTMLGEAAGARFSGAVKTNAGHNLRLSVPYRHSTKRFAILVKADTVKSSNDNSSSESYRNIVVKIVTATARLRPNPQAQKTLKCSG